MFETQDGVASGDQPMTEEEWQSVLNRADRVDQLKVEQPVTLRLTKIETAAIEDALLTTLEQQLSRDGDVKLAFRAAFMKVVGAAGRG